MPVEIQEILKSVVDRGASDLHLKVGQPPIIRVAGKLERTDFSSLSQDDLQRLVFSMLTPEQRRQIETTFELDCSYGVSGLGRFRVNVYKDRNSYAAALRTIPFKVPNFDDLDLPPIVARDLVMRNRGLILVTGPTGSGKSSTLAAIVNWINENKAEHILTIEDPIEFLHRHNKSIVSQRELGADTKSYPAALHSALREDPNVILLGEMRDTETIHTALMAAETGHLVLAAVHTQSASQTLDRIIDVFPQAQQQQVRVMLSNALAAILSQNLLPRKTPKPGASPTTRGRIAAVEVMINTPSIANLIREGKIGQIYSAIQMGGQQGMQTLEMALATLVKSGAVEYEAALHKAVRPDDFNRLVGPHAMAPAGRPSGTL